MEPGELGAPGEPRKWPLVCSVFFLLLFFSLSFVFFCFSLRVIDVFVFSVLFFEGD